MTEHLPQIYEDELLYSLFARFYIHNGYMIYRQAAEALFINGRERPDVLFLNSLRPEIKEQLERQKKWKKIIQNHTMYPFYGRFLKQERREKAFAALYDMQGNYHNLLPVKKRKPLCYCPLCVKNDRDRYGETYWHRSHQMEGVGVCPFHGVYLEKSNVTVGSNSSPSFASAELSAKQMQERTASEREWELAGYINDVFQSMRMPSPKKQGMGIGKYLDLMLSGTIYKSRRGKNRNIALLAQDYQKFIKDIYGEKKEMLEEWQIQKILTGYRFQMAEICGLAIFLGISSEELTQYTIPKSKGTTTVEKFDLTVRGMLDNGIGINETARRLGVSSKTVRDIRDAMGKKREAVNREAFGTKKKKDWMKEDIRTLPEVKRIISVLLGETGKRPRRITISAITRMLNLPEKRLEKLESCIKEVNRNRETIEQYWAREVKWAVSKIEADGEILNWKHIRNLTNMRKSYLEACMDLLDARTQKKIQGIL